MKKVRLGYSYLLFASLLFRSKYPATQAEGETKKLATLFHFRAATKFSAAYLVCALRDGIDSPLKIFSAFLLPLPFHSSFIANVRRKRKRWRIRRIRNQR